MKSSVESESTVLSTAIFIVELRVLDNFRQESMKVLTKIEFEVLWHCPESGLESRIQNPESRCAVRSFSLGPRALLVGVSHRQGSSADVNWNTSVEQVRLAVWLSLMRCLIKGWLVGWLVRYSLKAESWKSMKCCECLSEGMQNHHKKF
jgi:hypothetical protein